MTLLFNELKERLKLIDEITLMEILEISSEDLVERFEDYIEENYDRLSADLKWEEGDE